MITNNLLNREINVGDKLNSIYYSNNIIKTYYESSEYLYRYKIDIPEAYFLGDIINFSNDGNYMAIATFDDIFFWNLSSYSIAKKKKINTNCVRISSVTFNEDSSKIMYCGYNSTKDKYNLHVNDVITGEKINTYLATSRIIDLSSKPKNPDLVLMANRSKKLLSCDLRSSVFNEIKIKNLMTKPFFSSINFNPVQENMVLVTSDSKNDVFTFDLRNYQIIMNYNIPYNKSYTAYYACYNKKGTQILVTVSDMCPILFNSDKSLPIFEFDDFGYYSPVLGHYSCFAGVDDEYIAAGSENFSVYVWKIPKHNVIEDETIILKKINKSKYILKGHISEVKSVNYNHSKYFLASLGNEVHDKLILWSPFSFNSKNESKENDLSNDLSHETNLSIVDADNFTIFLLMVVPKIFYSFENHFCSYLKKCLSMKPDLIEKKFEENLSIQFIYSFIINFRINGESTNKELLEQFQKVLKLNLGTGTTLHVQYLVYFFETKKVFKAKFKIKNCIDFLKLHIKLSKKNKKKLIKLVEKKSTKINLERIKSLDKLIIVMKAMVYDLIIIYKINKNLYDVSFQLIKKLLIRIRSDDGLESLELKLLQDIFKRNYVDTYDAEENLILNNVINSHENNLNSNGNNLNDNNIESNEIGLNSEDNNTNSIINNTEFNGDNIESNNLDSCNNIDFVNTVSNFNNDDNSSSQNINLYSTQSNSNLIIKSFNSSNRNFLNENLKFCSYLINPKLSLFQHYNDQVLLELSNNLSFKQKFKKQFNSLR